MDEVHQLLVDKMCCCLFVVVPCAGQHRLLLLLMGVVPSPLLLQLRGCIHCSSVLEEMEQEFAESESARAEAESSQQECPRGADGKPGRQRHRRSYPKRLVGRSCLTQTWEDLRGRLKCIVDSKYFNRGIMIAILINTLSMGIEYHEQVRWHPCQAQPLSSCAPTSVWCKPSSALAPLWQAGKGHKSGALSGSLLLATGARLVIFSQQLLCLEHR